MYHEVLDHKLLDHELLGHELLGGVMIYFNCITKREGANELLHALPFLKLGRCVTMSANQKAYFGPNIPFTYPDLVLSMPGSIIWAAVFFVAFIVIIKTLLADLCADPTFTLAEMLGVLLSSKSASLAAQELHPVSRGHPAQVGLQQERRPKPRA